MTPAEDISAAPPQGFRLGSGEALDEPRIEARRFGRAGAPLVIVLGGISAGRQLLGEDGWWADMVGPGRAVDTDRYAALGLDFAPGGDQRVHISPDDQAALIEILLDAMGVKRAHALVGASYGGMVGLALAQRAPERLARLCVISAAHEPAPLASAWRGVQRRMVELALAAGKADEGLSLARQLAMITYRSAEEFEARFDRRLDGAGQSELDRYLISRGEAFLKRMPARRWISLSEAIDRTAVAPERVAVETTLAACTSDQLIPMAQMEELSRRLAKPRGFHTIQSIYGHDAFLKETAQLTPIIQAALESTPS